MLKRTKAHDKHNERKQAFGAFNRMFMRLSKGYENFVGRIIIKMRWLYLIPYAIIIAGLAFCLAVFQALLFLKKTKEC